MEEKDEIELKETKDEQDYVKFENPEKNNEINVSKRKKNIIIITSAVVLLICIIVIVIVILVNKDDKCELGEEEKCLTCKKNKCGSCNPGYILNNGKCEPTFSFRAVYETDKVNENINLFDILPEQITEMRVNGENVTASKNYTFEKEGTYEIYVLIDISNFTTLRKMF